MSQNPPRKNHWEQVYSQKRPDEVSWYQDDPEPSLSMILQALPGAGARVMDVGSGATRLIGALLGAGVEHLTALDISASALAAARAQLGPDAEKVQWLEGDVTQAALPGPFDVWHDRAVFHFLTDPEDQARYVAQVERALAPGGALILGTFAPDGPERCSGLPVARYDAEAMGRVFGAFEVEEPRNVVHTTPWGSPQSFTFARLRRRA